jgi:peroxin-1
LIRLELGLAVYYDSIQLQPARLLEIQNLGLEELQLEPVHVEDNWIQMPAWCRLRDHSEDGVELPAAPFDLEDDVAVLSLGAMVPRSWMEADYQGPIELYRIVPVNPPEAELSPRKSSATLSREDLASLWDRFREVGDGSSIPLPCPESDYFTNIAPTMLLAQDVSESSLMWAEETVKRMGKKGGGTLTCLCGPTGIGRTHSAFMVAALSRLRFQQATLYLDCKRLQESSGRMMEILAQLQTMFEQGVKGRSTLIILDELDVLAPNLSGEESDTAARSHSTNPAALDQSKLITDRLLQLIEAASGKKAGEDCRNISVLVTCPSAESVHPAILESCTLSSNVVAIPSMKGEERAALLGKMIGVSIPLDPAFVGPMTEGYRPRDLEKVASRARQMLRSDSSKAVDEVVSASLEGFVPLSQMSIARSHKASGLSWSELGGLFRVKEKLASTILHPAKYRLIYEKASVRLPRGVLLFGPPGCGKSALVPALARECNFPLITCKGPEVLDKYIGASEAKVRDLFARASAVAPSILFLDELDALAPRRGSDHTGVTDRVVNQLLTFLDGVEDAASATVYVLAATSRPDKVDPALLRPGRLEQHLFVGPPESDEEWSDTLSKIALNWNMLEQDRHFISSNDLVHEISNTMPHARRFAAADLKAVMDTAHVSAVHEALATKTVDEIKEVTIQMLHLKESLSKTRACLSPDDARELNQIYRPFLRDVDVAASVSGGEEANSSPTVRKLRTALR